MEWGGKALTNYMHVRIGKGKIGYWRELVGQRDAGCRRCSAYVEDRDYVAFHCDRRAEGQQWDSWEEMESGERWVEAEVWFRDVLDNG